MTFSGLKKLMHINLTQQRPAHGELLPCTGLIFAVKREYIGNYKVTQSSCTPAPSR